MNRALPLLLAALLAAPAMADGIPGFEGLAGGPETQRSEDRTPLPPVQVIDGFDPARDVPAMANWIPQANVEGAAHCFAMSLLTAQFFGRVDFVADERRGSPVDDDWSFDDLYERPLRADPAGVQLVYETLGVEGPGKVTVAGYPDLRAFTEDGAAGSELFRTVSEALQFTLQIPVMGLPYAKGVVFGSVDLLEQEQFTLAGLNARAARSVRRRLAKGILAPFTMHPAAARTEGHVILAYRAAERDGQVVLTCYDSNYPPVDDTARPTTVTLDLGTGEYEALNHAGRAVYTRYDLLTAVDPENYFTRGMTRRIARHLDRYLWMTDQFYAALEETTGEDRVDRWEAWKADFLPRWQATKDDLQDRTSWRLRARLKLPR